MFIMRTIIGGKIGIMLPPWISITRASYILTAVKQQMLAGCSYKLELEIGGWLIIWLQLEKRVPITE